MHATPSVDGVTYLGPTATLAMGRENYIGLQGVEPLTTLGFLRHIATQVLLIKKCVIMYITKHLIGHQRIF